MVTDFSGNNTYNRSIVIILKLYNSLNIIRTEVINFSMPVDGELESEEMFIPENFITYNYIATFLIENLSDSAEELNDRQYSVEEVHTEDDGLAKLTITDPHRHGE